jgi:hypothetical protein
MSKKEKCWLYGAGIFCVVVIIILILVFTLLPKKSFGTTIITSESNSSQPKLGDIDGQLRGPKVLGGKLVFDRNEE